VERHEINMWKYEPKLSSWVEFQKNDFMWNSKHNRKQDTRCKIKSKSNSSKEKLKKSLSSKKNVNVMGEDNE